MKLRQFHVQVEDAEFIVEVEADQQVPLIVNLEPQYTWGSNAKAQVMRARSAKK